MAHIGMVRMVFREKEDKQIQEMKKSYEEQLKHARLQMDEFRKDLLKQLEDSRREFQREREISNKQLELERAENQQLRNLLQHKKDEMSAMEIYYLKRESGQRREREEEFKVKEEPK
jgi:lipoate-protein ligase A